jgi:hypothetical protein
MKYKSLSWKQKVDPAFDKFIKVYLEGLEKMCLPARKGYIGLEERSFQTIELEGFPGLGSMYEHDRSLDLIIDVGIILDEPLTEEDMKAIRREKARKENSIFRLILEGAEMLREDSKSYYKNVFKPCISKEAYDEFVSTKCGFR